MKTKGTLIAFVIVLLFSALPSKSQNLTPPKDGAAIRLASNKIEVSSGGEVSADVWLVKSKRYVSREFGGLQAKAPEGIKISFEPKDANKNVFSMHVKADNAVAKGKFTVVIKGEGKNFQKVTSSVISLIVGDSIVAGTEQN